MSELTYPSPGIDATSPTTQSTADRELVTSRLLNAPRELVYKTWTDPQHVAQWWGPRCFTNTVFEMDVRPGGVWRYVMHGDDGTDYPNKVVYSEVVPNERLVYVHSDDVAEDEPQMEPFHVTVTFEAVGAQTQLTMRMRFASVAELERIKTVGAVEGVNSTFDSLEDYLTTL